MNERETAALLRTASGWRREGRRVALATVMKTWGSAPRPVGGRLVAAEDGAFAGSVSGGCVEGAVMAAALETMRDESTRVLHFGVADETAWEVGLSCGGEMEILLEPFCGARAERMTELADAIDARSPRALLTRVEDGAQQLLSADSTADSPAAEMALGILRDGGDARLELFGGARYFAEPFHPPRRLILFGGTHIAQALVGLARMAEFDPIVSDPRTAWATAARFPDVEILHKWPEDALSLLGTDSGTALAALTHDPKLDDPALICALRSRPRARYVGALGSLRTHEKRLARLRAEGLSEDALSLIHAPIGLDIGARTASEIALSVMAEVVSAFRVLKQ